MDELNQGPFQNKEGSRQSVFEEELPYLIPVRQVDYELTGWRIAKVQLNYHIQVKRNYYSVPSEYVQCEAEVRFIKNLIEGYFNQSGIASHKRIKNKVNQHSTIHNYMPDHLRMYAEHIPEKIIFLILKEYKKLETIVSCQDTEMFYPLPLIGSKIRPF